MAGNAAGTSRPRQSTSRQSAAAGRLVARNPQGRSPGCVMLKHYRYYIGIAWAGQSPTIERHTDTWAITLPDGTQKTVPCKHLYPQPEAEVKRVPPAAPTTPLAAENHPAHPAASIRTARSPFIIACTSLASPTKGRRSRLYLPPPACRCIPLSRPGSPHAPGRSRTNRTNLPTLCRGRTYQPSTLTACAAPCRRL